MNAEQAIRILQRVEYKQGWSFFVSGDPDFYLQARFLDGNGHAQKGRKWRLSTFMTKGEIVQTALMAVLAAEEHEAREYFTYEGARIFGPHMDVDTLVLASLKTQTRPEETHG